jgi:hypothetical protein
MKLVPNTLRRVENVTLKPDTTHVQQLVRSFLAVEVSTLWINYGNIFGHIVTPSVIVFMLILGSYKQRT